MKVLTTHGGKVVCDVGVDPSISSKAHVAGQRKIETGIPVSQHEDVDHELGETKSVGIGGHRLHPVQCLIETWQTQKSVDPHQWSLDANNKVEEVGGQQGG